MPGCYSRSFGQSNRRRTTVARDKTKLARSLGRRRRRSFCSSCFALRGVLGAASLLIRRFTSPNFWDRSHRQSARERRSRNRATCKFQVPPGTLACICNGGPDILKGPSPQLSCLPPPLPLSVQTTPSPDIPHLQGLPISFFRSRQQDYLLEFFPRVKSGAKK